MKPSILKATNNASGTKIVKKEKEIKKEDNLAKSMVMQNPKKLELELEKEENKNDKQKVNNINNIIYDVNNNINDIINKINSNIITNDSINNISASSGKKEVSFNVANDNGTKKDKKIDEEKKELRLSKAMQRIKKKQGGDANNAAKLRKSNKISEMAKNLENNMQRKNAASTEENNGNDVIYDDIDDNDNVVNVLKNQQLSKSIKKKKVAKTFVDDDE